MATRDEVMQAIRNADKAGDSESVRKLGAYLQSMSSAKPSAPQDSFDPSEGGGTLQIGPFDTGIRTPQAVDRTLAGIGAGMSRIGRAVTFQGKDAANEAAKYDAPLMATTAGKVGNFVGQTAAVAPTMLIPGANTYTGAALIGAGTGALTTEGDAKDRLVGAGAGMLGGVAGKAAGDVLAKGAGYVGHKIADRTASRQGIADAAKAAQSAGYVVPPVDVNPTVLNELVGGISGKIKTAQAASAKNQPVTNALAAKSLGLSVDEPITKAAIGQVRQDAGKAYEAVRNLGTVKADQGYENALNAIISANKGAAGSFPGLAKSPVVDTVEALRQPSFNASDAVDAIKVLRNSGDAAMRQGDKFTAKAYGQAATALEDVIDRNLQNSGAPGSLVNAFRDARKTIAKTYTVENALNPSTGDVSASALAKALKRGKPLSGELLDIANASTAFPKATQALQQATGSVSPLDFAVSAIKGDPKSLLTLGVRPALRAAQLSGPYQRNMVEPGANALTNALLAVPQNESLRRLGPGLSALIASNAAKQ